MNGEAALSPDGAALIVSVPLRLKRRGGRKRMIAPEGQPRWVPRAAQIDSTLIKAVARAFRWQRMLEGGEHGSIAELAAAERINPSYLARILRLTLLAPEIVEAILDGRHNRDSVTLERLMKPSPAVWAEQETSF